MKVKRYSLSWYTEKLALSEPFTIARYGDGEWLTILGNDSIPGKNFIGMQNSNGCTFTQELSDDLRAVLKRENQYQHAILGIAKRKKGDDIEAFLKRHKINIRWHDGDLFLNATLAGDFYPVVKELRTKRILYVGNEKLRGLNHTGLGFFEYEGYIQPPPQNAHRFKTQIVEQAKRLIRQKNIEVVGWSSGLASKVFIDEVFMEFPHITQIDFGSQWDGFFEPLDHIQAMGRSGSRSYIRKGGHDWEALLIANRDGVKE